MNQRITAVLVPESRRLNIAATLFGHRFPLQLEPAIYQFAGFLSEDYHGGYWHFYTLSNGGFYMAPAGEACFAVSAENGYEGELAAARFAARGRRRPGDGCVLPAEGHAGLHRGGPAVACRPA